MSKKRKNRKNHQHKAQTMPKAKPVAPTPAPTPVDTVSPTPSATTTSTQTKPAKKKMVIPIVIIILIIISIFAIIWFNPIMSASRKWKQDIGDKMPYFHLSPYVSEDEIHINYYGQNIGTIPSNEPAWISEGLELAKSGDTSEKALFAARYETENFYVESDYDYLYVIQGKEFDRAEHWRYCVWVLGDAYFNKPENMTDEVYDLIRPILIDLLK